MNIKLKLALVFCILITSIIAFFSMLPNSLSIKNQIGEKTETILVEIIRESGIEKIPLETYLIGVIASEMPADFELEALKAQAVASRSFAASRNYSVDDTTASQVYKDDETLRKQWGNEYESKYTKIHRAIEQTKGEIMVYQNEIISAVFFSSSNGYTNNSQDYWISETPYLVSVDSHWDTTENLDQIRSAYFDWNQLSALFGEGYSYEITSWYDNGYVRQVHFNDQEYSGRQVRELLGLASSSFEIIQDDTGITFITSGSGHGVGMSQYGANGMAKEGYDYQAILKHYYQGIEITQI